MSIRVLDPDIVSQIAAGEIIDRPSSVLKEVMENSLDAGAGSIHVVLGDGGIGRIQVRDDGEGISLEDLPRTILPHATSKLASAAALEYVSSLGFRGEALASIAQVARLSITSRAAGAENAWCLESIPDEKIRVPTPAAHPKGTTIEVEQLFYSIPARRKFLKRPATELNHASEMFRKIALGHPGVAFYLASGNRATLSLEATDPSQRFSQLLGATFGEDSLQVDMCVGPLRLWGFLERPTNAGSQGRPQYLYVNGRWVRNRVVAHAIEQAYKDVLFHGRKPRWVIFLSLPPSEVDVNVHPMKHEVRFRDSQAVHHAIYEATRAALAETKPAASPTSLGDLDLDSGTITRGDKRGDAACDLDRSGASEPVQSDLNWPSNFAKRNERSFAADQATGNEPDTVRFPMGRILGQIDTLYLVAETDRGLAIIDMHAAHERVLYEKLKKTWGGEHVAQRLLEPIEVHLEAGAISDLYEARNWLLNLGLEFDQIGPECIAVRSLPMMLQNQDPRFLLEDIAAALSSDATASEIVKIETERVLAGIACRMAVRSGRRLRYEEMVALARQIEETPRSDQCNHGRPTWVEMDFTALDRLFRRGK